MGLLSFLSRRAALPAMTTAEAEALRTRLATMSALLDDVSMDLVRMRRREEAQNARVDFLSRQVRELAEASKGRGKAPDWSEDPEVAEFFAFIDAAAGGAVRGVPDRVASELEGFFVSDPRPRE